MKVNHLQVTQEAGKAFFMQQIQGEVTMLNLLKFRVIADYSTSPELKSEVQISGYEAYQLYIKYTLPLLEKAGSEIIFHGKGGSFLIGPESENWDLVLLVKHKSVAAFMAFANDKNYLKTAGHRTAALEDSRLLPIT
jgi:uncharacterized protein (DUF1330 family)